MYTVLPLGLSTAYYIFTKVVHLLVHYWRAKGLRILVYWDDRLCGVSGAQAAQEASQLVRKVYMAAHSEGDMVGCCS